MTATLYWAAREVTKEEMWVWRRHCQRPVLWTTLTLERFFLTTCTHWSNPNDSCSQPWKQVRPPYPVEELFKLLDEQLHSAGLHRSAERAVEELHRNVDAVAKEVYLHHPGLILEDWGSVMMQRDSETWTHLIHTVALPNNSTINSVLKRKKIVKMSKNWKK